jgi:hypothetical protein
MTAPSLVNLFTIAVKSPDPGVATSTDTFEKDNTISRLQDLMDPYVWFLPVRNRKRTCSLTGLQTLPISGRRAVRLFTADCEADSRPGKFFRDIEPLRRPDNFLCMA